MNFLELVNKRQSCRAYDPARPVEKEKIDRCIEAVRLAPIGQSRLRLSMLLSMRA